MAEQKNSCNMSKEKLKKENNEVKVGNCSFKTINQTKPIHIATICCNLSKEEMTKAFYFFLNTL